LAAAIDFCRLPRWSMAAAAMMPSLFDSALRCFILPADSDMDSFYPPEIRLRTSDIFEDLCLQCFGAFELPLIPHSPQEFELDSCRCIAPQRLEQKCLDGEFRGITKRRAITDIGDRIPSVPSAVGSSHVHAARGQHLRIGAQIQGRDGL